MRAEVRSLARGLALLRALNRRGRATAGELAADTGLARATTYRLLATLAELGYVARDPRGPHFLLNYLVRELADGFGDEEWLVRNAGPIVAGLRDEIPWPMAIATPRGDAMHVRITTSDRSPLALTRVPVGYGVPVLQSAVGRAYFAFLPGRTRAELATLLAAAGGDEAKLARNTPALEQMVRQVRRLGYAQRVRGFNAKTSSIAVPILGPDGPIASLNVSWHHAALTVGQATERFLPALQRAAGRIEAAVRAAAPSHQADNRTRRR